MNINNANKNCEYIIVLTFSKAETEIASETDNLADIIRKIDGPIAMLPCASLNFYERCANCDEKSCGLHATMVLVRDATLNVLGSKTVGDLANSV